MNKRKNFISFRKGRMIVVYWVMCALNFITVSSLYAQAPTALQVAEEMKIGWNIGNSLEVPQNNGGETGWGNPATTQQLIDAVRAAGFGTVRIPCAWDSYADQATFQIDPTWLARVREVVDYCINNGMYVVLNSHWDGGWLEEHPLYAYQESVNQKQDAYWRQIANYFMDYDEHLLFAGTNEVRADYGTPTAEHIEVQESYNQTFVDAVRATGGNNLDRILIVQTYNTNIWHGLDYFTMPDDQVNDRMIVEVHHYDPYDFTLNQNGGCIYWGSSFPEQSACNWGQESYMDDLFSRVKTKWTSQGVPVIIGEYGVIKRTSLTGQELADHIASRNYYLEYVTRVAVENGVIPIYWDNGWNGENGFAIFDRNSGAVVDQEALGALMAGAGIGNPDITYTVSTSANGSGTVTVDPPGGSYDGGTSVTITAVPDAGWQFTGWTGDLSGSSNPVTVSISKDMNVTANFTQEGTGGTGTILREYWTDITGTTINALTSDADYPSNPTGSGQLTSLEGPVDWGDNYGTRIRGYVHPPVTGLYTFWIAGDDYTDLYLSTDDSPASAARVAYVEGWTNSGEWTKYATQSTTVTLTAGQRYYIEILHKEGQGGDNVAVAWQGPGISQRVIEGAYLSPYDTGSDPDQFILSTSVTGSGSVSLNPSAGSYDAGTTVTITATPADGWQFSSWSGDLSGAGNPTTIQMNSHQSVTAVFTQVQGSQFTLNTTVAGSGEISLSPAGGIYDEGTVVSVSAIPVTGWQFTGWGGDLSGPANPATITMNANYAVTANFSQDEPGGTCDNPVAVSLPFSMDGAGQYCWEISQNISYINSWNLDLLEINGVDYTNVWSNSLPPKIDGNYYIQYSGAYAWSHFEAKAAANSRVSSASSLSDVLTFYPNPFHKEMNVVINQPQKVESIMVQDLSGRRIFKWGKSAIGKSLKIGEDLKAGIYMLRVESFNDEKTFFIIKR